MLRRFTGLRLKHRQSVFLFSMNVGDQRMPLYVRLRLIYNKTIFNLKYPV
jgi:hypothetical protein